MSTNEHDREHEQEQEQEDEPGRGGQRSGRRKERVLHTRISEELSEDIRRFAEDQEYIEEFKEAYRMSYWIWLVLTDCGRSMVRVVLWSAGLTLLFALIYSALGEQAFAVSNKATLGWNFFTAVYYSVVTFTTLGFGDITPLTPVSAIVVMIEVVVGYVMLGILISILATKVARRS